ncbi:hypothetical protein O979_20485, partial [Mycobacterium avium subsp. paratuberculosis 10-4404]
YQVSCDECGNHYSEVTATTPAA